MGGSRGSQLQQLSVATMRSVATGVIGVAVIQSLLLGVGFLQMSPQGVLAVLTLFIGIVQLPALIITLPVLGWLWGSGDGSTAMNGVITVYLIIAGLSDGVLKPMLLGRGGCTHARGADRCLGGMVGMGMIGLFLGSVILAVGYQLLWAGWIVKPRCRARRRGAAPGASSRPARRQWTVFLGILRRWPAAVMVPPGSLHHGRTDYQPPDDTG